MHISLTSLNNIEEIHQKKKKKPNEEEMDDMNQIEIYNHLIHKSV